VITLDSLLYKSDGGGLHHIEGPPSLSESLREGREAGGGSLREGGAPPTSLDYSFQNLPLSRRDENLARRRGRLYHRVLSGLEVARVRGLRPRIMCLTSKYLGWEGFKRLERDFLALVKRIRRKYGLFEYIAVKELTDRGFCHIHAIFVGPYIPQSELSEVWEAISGFKIVFIQSVYGSERRLGGYLGKYLIKGSFCRYGFSFGWVFRGFVGVWRALLRRGFRRGYSMAKILSIWRRILRGELFMFGELRAVKLPMFI
jgi:hypothetical protein